MLKKRWINKNIQQNRNIQNTQERDILQAGSLGFLGSFCSDIHDAAIAYASDYHDLAHYDNYTDMLQDLLDNHLSFAMIEQTVFYSDLLFKTLSLFTDRKIQISSTYSHPIKRCLFGHNSNLKAQERLYSTPLVLNLFNPWIKKNLPYVECKASPSFFQAASIASWDVHSYVLAPLSAVKIQPLIHLKNMEWLIKEKGYFNLDNNYIVLTPYQRLSHFNALLVYCSLQNLTDDIVKLVTLLQQYNLDIKEIKTLESNPQDKQYYVLITIKNVTKIMDPHHLLHYLEYQNNSLSLLGYV